MAESKHSAIGTTSARKSGDSAPAKIDEFHLHELMDRIHCVSVMFDELVHGHSAASLIQKDIDKVSVSLGRLYQKAGDVRFNKDGDAK